MNRVSVLSLYLAVLLASLAVSSGGEAKTPRTDLYGDPLPPGAVARLGTIRLRHAKADVRFSADGKHLISCGGDEVRVWNAASGKLQRRTRLAWKRPNSYHLIPTVTLSPGGTTAAVWDGNTVYLCDTATGKERRRLVTAEDFLHGVPLLTFSADGKTLIVQSRVGKSRLGFQFWDIEEGKKRQNLASRSAIVSLRAFAVAARGRRLAGIDHADEVHLWDEITGQEVRPREGESLRGQSLAFSPNGKTLALSSRVRGKVRLLDAATLKERAELTVPADVKVGCIDALTFSANGQLLAGTYGDASGQSKEAGVLIWNMAAAEKAQRLPERSAWSTRLVFAPDSKTLACFDQQGSAIRLWDVASGRQLCQRPGHDTAVHALTVAPDGRTVASGSYEPAMRLWDATTGKPLRTMKGDDDWIHACLFTADGKRVISAGTVGMFQVWDAATGKEVRRIEMDWPPRGVVILHAVSISADGERLFAAASGGEQSPRRAQLFVWNLASGKQLLRRPYQLEPRIRVIGREVETVAEAPATLAPDGDRMTAWLGERVGIVDISTEGVLATLPKGISSPMLFSPDGRLLAAAILRTKRPFDVTSLSVIETASGEEIVRLEVGAFTRAAFTSDGRAVVVADQKSLSVWDSVSGERLYRMAWPDLLRDADGATEIGSLAVLPDGRAATGMAEGDILIWDLHPSTWPTRKAVRDLGKKELDSLWTDLAGDARKAQRAVQTLAASTQTVSLLSEHLQPATVDGKRIEKLLADLDSDVFEAREAASRELARLRFRAEPLLRRTLERKPSLEMRRRLQAILAEPNPMPIEALQTLRGIAVLERIGTPNARHILEKLSSGMESPETREAQTALQRLKRRDAWTKEKTSP